MVAPSLATSIRIRGSVYPLFTPWPGHTAPISPNAHQVGKSERLPQNIFSGRPARLPGRDPGYELALISPNAHQPSKSERLPQNTSFGPGRQYWSRPVPVGLQARPSNLLMHIDLAKTTALPPKIFCQDALSVATVPERGSNSPSYLLNAQRLGKNGRVNSKILTKKNLHTGVAEPYDHPRAAADRGTLTRLSPPSPVSPVFVGGP